jgi:plastocyanin domain-containing protein
MFHVLVVATLGTALALAACSKDEAPAKRNAPVAEKGPDGVRRIPVEAGKRGYDPDRITASAGEKLKLVFTRTAEGECLSKVKTPEGTLVDLPLNQPVEVAMTAPQSGELTFVCGMDMVSGVIAVQ